jgi:putative ABC transport system permease protein
MGITLREGRLFVNADDDKAPRVAIVNETLAARHFPGATAVGKRLQFAGDPERTLEIVGVVRDTRTEALSAAAEPEVYVSFWQNSAFSKHLVVRTSSDPRALMAAVREQVRNVDPTAAVERFTTMAQVRRTSVAPQTFAMRLIVGFAALAATLSLVGVYGVLSLSVGSRVKEMAVRKAVGAQRRDILRLVLGEGGRLIAIGVVMGIGVAVLFGRALAAYLYDVEPADPLSLGIASVAFGAIALGACVIPALRAARTDLLAALRQD